MSESHQITATAKGERLDKAIAAQLPELTRSQVHKLIEAGNVLLNGDVPRKFGVKLDVGDVIDVTMPEPEPSEMLAENIPLDILYEDDDVIVVNKPAGMVVHPSPGHYTGTLVNAVLGHCPDIKGVGGAKRPGLVHRLDKDTSGVIILAKHDDAHRFLQAQFKDREVEKSYYALVHGELPSPMGTVETNIDRDPRNRKRMAAYPPRHERGRLAISHFTALQQYDAYTLVDVNIETGRTHQIRVHMAFLGNPVAGDDVYGTRTSIKNSPVQLKRQFLHAYRLVLQLPSNIEKTFESRLPEDLQSVLEYL